jgi:hypothetical protein
VASSVPDSHHHPDAITALLRANRRGADLRAHETATEKPPYASLLRGAPSHSAAYILQALDEQGWKLVPVE